MYRRYFEKSSIFSDAHDITIVTDEPISTTVLSVASGTFRIVAPSGHVVGAGPQDDVGREERAEEHDFGREKQPDAELDVVQPGVGPRLYGVGNLFHRQRFSVACPTF